MESSADRRRAIADAMSLYEGPLIGYAQKITGDVETARDVVQDTFMKLCGADLGKLNGRLAPWLYTVCRNRALDVMRHRQRTQELTNGKAPPEHRWTSPFEAAAGNEQRDAIKEATAALSESQQELLDLKFSHGLTYREISGVTGLSVATVSHHMNDAIHAIREALSNPENASTAKEKE